MKHLFLKDNNGQAMVELALVLPILLVLFMGVVEFGRIFHSYLIITNASREGARVAITGKSDADIEARVDLTTSSLEKTEVTTTISPAQSLRRSGSLATVEVKYNVDLIFPLFDLFVPDPLPISASTTMRVE
ncbi:MAG: TadE family protein [Bacillota bacterium]